MNHDELFAFAKMVLRWSKAQTIAERVELWKPIQMFLDRMDAR